MMVSVVEPLEARLEDQGELATSPPRTAALRTEHLRCSFGGVVAVDDVSLSLPTGTITAMIGPNGAGKSTIFNLLTGHLRPDVGRVFLRELDVTGYPPYRLARMGLGRAFQEVRLFPELTCLENVAVFAQTPSSGNLLRVLLLPYGQARSDRKARARAAQALGYMGLANRKDTLVASLSFGEQKLVALARLLALDASIFLLDEPASGLDEASRSLVIDKIAQLAAEGFTVCVVEHNLDVVRQLAAHVVFLAQGRVIAEGNPEKVFATPELAEIYFGYHHD